MSIQRIFLGWEGPCLPRATRWLHDRYGHKQGWASGSVTVVTPGRRAARRLLELLVQQAEGEALTPPSMATVGQLPEMLYTPPRAVADPLRSVLAWVAALRQASPETQRAIVAHPPDQQDLLQWYYLALDLALLSDELGGEAVTFSQIIPKCEAVVEFFDRARWEALTRVHEDYRRILAQDGYQEKHEARLEAIQQDRCNIDHDLVLVATADMNRTTRLMLQQRRVAPRVTVLVQAPESQAHTFDDVGCFITQPWLKHRLNIANSSVHFVDRPCDQADVAQRLIQRHADPNAAADQATIGLGDPTLGTTIQRTLESAGLPVRPSTGRPIEASRPSMLLAKVGAFLKERRVSQLADLLRHPDLEAYLNLDHLYADPSAPRHSPPTREQAAAEVEEDSRKSPGTIPGAIPGAGVNPQGWLTLLDRYMNDHLQGRLTEHWLGDEAVRAGLAMVYGVVKRLLSGVMIEKRRPLPQWSEPIAALLRWVYEPMGLSRNQRDEAEVAEALGAIANVLREQSQLNPMSPMAPTVDAADAISLTLARLAGQTITPEGGQVAVELLGWLELPLDDAPLLVITGFNEGLIPESVTGDALVPDRIRTVLGLRDNRRRYARDVMMLQAILASRAHVSLIAGRRGKDDQPLPPSRLLLGEDDEQMIAGIERFFGRGETQREPQHTRGLLFAPSPQSGFTIPMPSPQSTQPIDRLHITAFRDYLACPYRFYIKHILGLEAIDDQAVEMDGAAFGRVAHEVLASFGRDAAVAYSHEVTWIQRYLLEQLRRVASERFGDHPPIAVQVQCENLRDRLNAFAQWQAQQNADGWRVMPEHVEVGVRAVLDVDGQPFTITGRIDRIDQHLDPSQGYRLIDYKTSDNPIKPDQQHRRGPKDAGHWVDLQLPLYRTLAGQIGITGHVDLGYLQLPKQTGMVGFEKAPWSSDELADAMQRTRQVIRDIRQGRFWQPGPPPTYDDGYHWICLDASLERAEVIARSQQGAIEPTGTSR